MTKLQKIKKLVSKYKEPNAMVARMKIKQQRLQELVELHGEDVVVQAGGYTHSTLKQYLRVSNPNNIGTESLTQAEYVLSRL